MTISIRAQIQICPASKSKVLPERERRLSPGIEGLENTGLSLPFCKHKDFTLMFDIVLKEPLKSNQSK